MAGRRRIGRHELQLDEVLKGRFEFLRNLAGIRFNTCINKRAMRSAFIVLLLRLELHGDVVAFMSKDGTLAWKALPESAS